MTDRKRIMVVATLAMVCLAVVVTTTGTIVSYRYALREKESDLLAFAQHEALVIEAVFEHGSDKHGPSSHPHNTVVTECSTCSEKVALITAVLRRGGNLHSGTDTGVEFVVGNREADTIHFLLPPKRSEQADPQELTQVPWRSDLAEPMRLALLGKTGMVEAQDYRGEIVLAAYAPVEQLGWGVVAKIDMAEMRAPFLVSARDSLVIAGLAILIGAVALRKWLEPLVQRSQDSEDHAIAELQRQKYAVDEHAIVAITDPSGKITYANDKFCEISKYSREELMGQDHRIINSRHHPRSVFVDMWKTISDRKVWRGELCNRAKDGALYWVDTTIVPFTNSANVITQYVAIRTDITKRKQAETALIQSLAAAESAESADRAKSEFLANMSHEIRTPMTAILGFAENMLDADQSESDRLTCIHTIRHNGDYLLKIINDILDLSKIEAGRITIERADCRPCQIIADVASLIRVHADAKGLLFDIDYAGPIPETVLSDPTRLRQILINLIGNAIKFIVYASSLDS